MEQIQQQFFICRYTGDGNLRHSGVLACKWRHTLFTINKYLVAAVVFHGSGCCVALFRGCLVVQQTGSRPTVFGMVSTNRIIFYQLSYIHAKYLANPQGYAEMLQQKKLLCWLCLGLNLHFKPHWRYKEYAALVVLSQQ